MISDDFLSFDELCPYIRKAGRQRNASWKKTRRIYDHEMLYCVSGKAHIQIEDRYHEILPGSLIIIKPNTKHSFWHDDNIEAEIYWVHFDLTFHRNVYKLEQYIKNSQKLLFLPDLKHKDFIRTDPTFENGFRLPTFSKVNNIDYFDNLFESLLDSFEKHQDFWQLDCKIVLLRILKNIFMQFSQNKPIKRYTYYHYAEIAEMYILKNYSRQVLVSDISDYLGINVDYFRRCFKKKTGINVLHYLNLYRIMKAKEFMFNSDLSIAEIAEMVGYSDAYYFCKVVKKYEGVSPSKLRKML